MAGLAPMLAGPSPTATGAVAHFLALADHLQGRDLWHHSAVRLRVADAPTSDAQRRARAEQPGNRAVFRAWDSAAAIVSVEVEHTHTDSLTNLCPTANIVRYGSLGPLFGAWAVGPGWETRGSGNRLCESTSVIIALKRVSVAEPAIAVHSHAGSALLAVAVRTLLLCLCEVREVTTIQIEMW